MKRNGETPREYIARMAKFSPRSAMRPDCKHPTLYLLDSDRPDLYHCKDCGDNVLFSCERIT